ncbi:MAG: AbrB/MazE/SpoVT family DNA-binding domain-containing protein [Thermoplasmatota archaeon]
MKELSKAAVSKVTRKHQITVPKEIRESMSIKEGDYLALITNGEELILKKLELPSWDEVYKKGEISAEEKEITKEEIIKAVREERKKE